MNSIFDEPILHIEQTNWNTMTGQFEFNILDHHGNTLATVREPKQHLWKTVFRNVTGTEYKARHFMHVDGPDGEPLFAIDKHNSTFSKSASIQLPNVGEVGRLKKVNFNPVAPRYQIADGQGNFVIDISVIPKGAAFRTYNYRVIDSDGYEIAEMLSNDPETLMTRAGLSALFTLEIKAQIAHELRVLLVGAFVAVEWFDDQQGLH